MFLGVDTSGQTDIDVQLVNVRFGQDASYVDNDGNLPVVMLFDRKDENGNLKEDQLFSIGKGFKVVDGGEGIEHSVAKFNKSDSAGFSTNSKGQTFLDSIAACEGGVEKLTARFEELGVGPRNAAFWEGLSVHYVEEIISFGKPDADGKQKSFRQPIAEKLYGWDGFPVEEDEVVEVKATKPKPTPRKPAPKVEAVDTLGIDPQLYAELVDLAKASADFDTFIGAAYELDEIADETVQGVVDDEATGIWSRR